MPEFRLPGPRNGWETNEPETPLPVAAQQDLYMGEQIEGWFSSRQIRYLNSRAGLQTCAFLVYFQVAVLK